MIKVAFLTKNLDIGGIERAILNYLNYMDKLKYEITLFLDEGEGIYLNEVPKDVKIVNLNMCKSRNFLWRKIVNFFKLGYYSLKYYHKFDFAASFTTTVKSNTILAKRFSSNNAIWYHGEYWNTDEEAKRFVKYSNSLKYKKVVFVSNYVKDKYVNFTHSKQNLFVINNPIDHLKMIKNSQEDLGLKREKYTFLNVGRHEEKAKNLIALLNVTDRLLKDEYDFDLWMVGSGPDTDLYKSIISRLQIEDHVKMFGKQSNVYPFYKIADAFVLTSVTEGNPVVYLEAKVMNLPIISTNVSDAKIELDGYGIVCDINEDAIYEAMKEFLDKGYKIKNPFDPVVYNRDVLSKLYEVIGL